MCYNELLQHVQAHQIGVDILDRASVAQAESLLRWLSCHRDNVLARTKSVVTVGEEADSKSKTVLFCGMDTNVL